MKFLRTLPDAANRFATAGLHIAALFSFLILGTFFAVQPATAQEQCLKITVVDPSGVEIPNATVSIGAIEQRTDGVGVATFCNLGDGPHSVVVLAPGFAPYDGTLSQSVGEVTIELDLAKVTEQIVVIGSRAEPRSAIESTVPVDVIRTEDLVSQGSRDLVSQLRTVIPSFNINTQPISDAATVVRPASGLSQR